MSEFLRFQEYDKIHIVFIVYEILHESYRQKHSSRVPRQHMGGCFNMFQKYTINTLYFQITCGILRLWIGLNIF